MPDAESVARHYARSDLVDAIRVGIEKLGKTPATLGVQDLAPVDHFHIGGWPATEAFLGALALTAEDRVLDVGCGLGGASRFVAHRYGCRVTGIDLTPAYVETGRVLTHWVGLEDRVVLDLGDAGALPHPEASFDLAFLMHVGMNVADKRQLFAALHRILRPGGQLLIYDIMALGDTGLAFPMPWAPDPTLSFVEPPAAYRAALEGAGFAQVAERNRRDFALHFFAEQKAAVARAGGPPPLGLHLVMGETAPIKLKNMMESVEAGQIAPVEFSAEKRA